MSDVSAPTSSARSPSPDTGRVGRGGSAADAPHDQSQSTAGQAGDQNAASSNTTRGDPAVILSSTLTHLQAGQRFAAIVIGQIPDGRLVLDSPQGVFVVDLKTSLALGPLAVKTDVLLQVVKVGDDIEAAIVAMNNVHVHPPRPVVLTLADMHGSSWQVETAEIADTVPTAGLPEPALPTAAKGPAGPQTTTSGQATAVVAQSERSETQQAAEIPIVKSAAPSPEIGKVLTVEPATLSGSPDIRPGTQLKLAVVAIEDNATPTSEPAVRSAPNESSALTALIRRAAPTPASAALSAAPQPAKGVQVQATVVTRPAPSPAAKPLAAPAAPAPAATPKTAFLQTPFGLMRVTDGPKLPEGTRVTVEVTDVVTPQPPVSRPARLPFDQAGLAATDLTRDWSSLTQVMKSAGVDVPPHMLGHVAVPTLNAAPTPTPTASLQFFLAALRLGDVKGWLGQDLANRIDQSADPGLMSRIGGDFAAASRAAHDGSSSEWRPVMLPVHDGSGIQPVAWFIRRPYEAKDGDARAGGGLEKQSDHGTRFVIELDHRSLGEMQLDGLVHAKRFDLVVRSHRPLSETIRRDIAGLFRKVLDGAGAEGDVLFHTDRKFPIALRADMAHRAFEARPHPDRA